MNQTKRKQLIARYLFSVVYTIGAILTTLLIALKLQSGSSGVYLFIRDDLLTDLDRIIFICGFPFAYLISLLACQSLLRMPRFDFINRIIVTNLVVYGFFGLALSASRIHLFSRTVVLSEFITTACLLVGFYFFRHRFYPNSLGVLQPVNFEFFSPYPYLRVERITTSSPLIDTLDGIITDLQGNRDDETSYFLSKLAQKRIPVYDANTLIETLWGRIPLANVTATEIENFTPPEFYPSVKRVLEVLLILSLSTILFIFSLIICIAIKLDSRGPILFTQPRAGQYGRSFNMLKFRSMYVSPNNEGIRFAERNDKRVTRVGRLLRRLRLDELPQMWNVLRGEMSLIGPRPEQLEFTTRFNRLIPFYGFRHTVRPGITGWAQVMYGYADSDDQTRAKLEFDFFYIKHMSLWLDIVVYIKTLRTIIIGSGSR